MLPIETLVIEYRELGLVLAVLIGFGFGFVLERAGFGNARKLAAQFYLHDMTVFKVMFTAIITAMLGIVAADGLGLADLRAVSESAVVASPDPLRGEVVKAFVVLKPGYAPSSDLAAELQEHVRRSTAPYKYPRALEFVDRLPKTTSGKIKRAALRAAEWDGRR